MGSDVSDAWRARVARGGAQMNPRPNTGAAGRAAGHGFLAALLLGSAMLAACQPTRMAVAQKEDGLSASGFIVRQADVPERQTLVNLLPANRMSWYQRGGAVHYLYADPRWCNCLYVGTQEAYDKWRSYAEEHHLNDERPVTAVTVPDAAWNWGTWGPWAPYPGFDAIPPNLGGMNQWRR